MNNVIFKGVKMMNYICSKVKIKNKLNTKRKYYLIAPKRKKYYINCISALDNHYISERIPKTMIKGYGSRIKRLNRMMAGLTIRFETDSEFLVFEALYRDIIAPICMSLSGACGIDVYLTNEDNYKWLTCICPSNQFEMFVSKKISLPPIRSQILLYLPNYASVETLNIIISSGAEVTSCEQNNFNGIICFYGSSITQGCAASRPGLAYPNILGRLLNMRVMNFGYSESAKGQKSIIEYISKIHSNIYIIEYDHNANVEHLNESHFKVYKSIRKENPYALIVLLSRFSGGISINDEEENIRINIIKQTYEKGINNGDKNLIFICGKGLMIHNDDYFSDEKHPNDRGMYFIANLIAEKIQDHNKLRDKIDV